MWQLLRDNLDEAILFIGVMGALVLLGNASFLGYWALWGSLVLLVITAAYYSRTFFQADDAYRKFFFFLLLIPSIIFYFALIYKALGIIDTQTGDILKGDWLEATYFSVVTWSTLGYGDYKPTDEVKKWVMAEVFIGYIFMGLLVGKVLFLLQQVNNSED